MRQLDPGKDAGLIACIENSLALGALCPPGSCDFSRFKAKKLLLALRAEEDVWPYNPGGQQDIDADRCTMARVITEYLKKKIAEKRTEFKHGIIEVLSSERIHSSWLNDAVPPEHIVPLLEDGTVDGRVENLLLSELRGARFTTIPDILHIASSDAQEIFKKFEKHGRQKDLLTAIGVLAAFARGEVARLLKGIPTTGSNLAHEMATYAQIAALARTQSNIPFVRSQTFEAISSKVRSGLYRATP